MFCRPCGREHRGPECPVDELGRPSPAPGLVLGAAANTAPPWGFHVNAATFSNGCHQVSYVVSGGTGSLYIDGNLTTRPPDDDGLAGVPALVRR